ncbi:MAG: putative DNA binding domain-containing protein [Deltaproteobacteria bacterium]|nr:putative DNA binding domain-containing protein [Deltaproteobacteria bacterium]
MKRPVAELLAELRTAEAKKGLGDSALETISAFSNEPDLGGGTMLFGVIKRDGEYEVIGVPHPETFTANLQSQVSDETLNRPIRPTIWTEMADGKAIVAVFVPEAKAADKPIYLRKPGLPKGAFRRIGNGDVQCTDEDIRLLLQLATETAYEDSLAAFATMDDLDTQVIEQYRAELLKRRPDSAIRTLDAYQTVQALGCTREDDGVLKPTVAGILLFAKPLSLARIFPLVRVDYIRMSGTKWIEGDSVIVESLDVQQPLLVTFRKIFASILDDLPKSARFERGSPIRIDEPTVPARAIREALVNALSHRDYRTHTPTQVIRYSNRIEFRNAGYSLVEEEKLGQPGSASRNPRIARVFRDIGVAENIGSGIRLMRQEMEAAKLARPLFDSSREANRFVATLMFTHLFTSEQRTWLGTVGDSLTKEQQLALVYCREVGEIRNAVLRDLTGLDTLTASVALRGLRDRGLVEPRGASSQTYYVLGPSALVVAVQGGGPTVQGGELDNPPFGPETGLQTETGGLGTERVELENPTEPSERGELIVQGGELRAQGGELENPQARDRLLASLPEQLRNRVRSLPKRASEERLRAAIVDLCGARQWTPAELSVLLGRSVRKLVDKHLTPLVREGRLERTHETLTHPDQAYRTKIGSAS